MAKKKGPPKDYANATEEQLLKWKSGPQATLTLKERVLWPDPDHPFRKVSTRLRGCLYRIKVTTVEELRGKRPEQLLRIPNFGVEALREVEATFGTLRGYQIKVTDHPQIKKRVDTYLRAIRDGYKDRVLLSAEIDDLPPKYRFKGRNRRINFQRPTGGTHGPSQKEDSDPHRSAHFSGADQVLRDLTGRDHLGEGG